jgi:hypothetical protein
MTLVPSFLATGVLAIISGGIVTIWSATRVRGKNGGLILILLSVAMLLVGGGIFPPVFGIIAGIIGTRIRQGNDKHSRAGWSTDTIGEMEDEEKPSFGSEG